MFSKLRAFADIGRTQGITTTASIAIVGALTSTVAVEWYYIIFFTLISIIAHMALNTYIAIGDKELDAQTYVPSRNPLSAGILSKKGALFFVYGGTVTCIILILLLLLYISFLSVLMCFLCFLLSYGSLLWYGWKGKKVLLSYDFTFSVSYSFFVLFGVFAIGGMPTNYTWIFIGVVIFAATAFAQWENGLKDADADRFAGVRSIAVVTQVKNNKRLSLTLPVWSRLENRVPAVLFSRVVPHKEPLFPPFPAAVWHPVPGVHHVPIFKNGAADGPSKNHPAGCHLRSHPWVLRHLRKNRGDPDHPPHRLSHRWLSHRITVSVQL